MTRAVSFRFFESQLTHAQAHKTKWQNECRIGDWESDSSFRLSPPHPFQSCRLYLELTAPQNTLLIQQCAFVQEKYWNVEDNHTRRREFLYSPSSSSPSIISLYKYVSRRWEGEEEDDDGGRSSTHHSLSARGTHTQYIFSVKKSFVLTRLRLLIDAEQHKITIFRLRNYIYICSVSYTHLTLPTILLV